MISEVALSHRDLAGVHFTGLAPRVFNSMWKTIGANMSRYRSYPRIVGETGGKDFIVAHASADPQALAVAIVRGGFEYQGQKCSAVSRVYVPRSLWQDVRDRAVAMLREIKMGDVRDFRNFMGAVIDEQGLRQDRRVPGGGEAQREDRRRRRARTARRATSSSRRWWRRTIPAYRLLCEEIFGPVVTVHVYDDARWAETLQVVDQTSPYALTGAVFAQDRRRCAQAASRPAQRRRQLLHQRQADGRGGRPAALRRRARLGHQRQGRLEAQPRALGQRAHGQGDLRAAAGLSVPVHGRGVGGRVPRAALPLVGARVGPNA